MGVVEEFIKKTEEMNKIKDIDETIRDEYFFLDYSKCVCDILKENQELRNQQKEFIAWLEYKLRTSYKSSSRYYYFSIVLSKYKEIAGGNE